MWRLLFGGSKRLDDVEDGQSALARENRSLRAKVARLEAMLVQRRADDIVGARDCLIPVPRPGSSAARLLGQNRALRKAAKAADARADRVVEAAMVDMFAVADGLEADGLAQAAADVRARADALVARAKAPPVDSSAEVSVELYGELVRSSWASVDHLAAADDWIARVRALEPTTTTVLALDDQRRRVAGLGGLIVSTLLSSGPSAAGEVLRGAIDVTEDGFAVGAEATLYALAGALGDGWTEDVRTAWSLAIDAISKALGFPGHGAPIFSLDDSLGISQG